MTQTVEQRIADMREDVERCRMAVQNDANPALFDHEEVAFLLDRVNTLGLYVEQLEPAVRMAAAQREQQRDRAEKAEAALALARRDSDRLDFIDERLRDHTSVVFARDRAAADIYNEAANFVGWRGLRCDSEYPRPIRERIDAGIAAMRAASPETDTAP